MLRNVYEIKFKDDTGTTCCLTVEGEEMVRALVHNGYEITVQGTIAESKRLDIIHAGIDRMDEQSIERGHAMKQRAVQYADEAIQETREVRSNDIPSSRDMNVGMEVTARGY